MSQMAEKARIATRNEIQPLRPTVGMPPVGMPPVGMPPVGMPPFGMPPGAIPSAGIRGLPQALISAKAASAIFGPVIPCRT